MLSSENDVGALLIESVFKGNSFLLLQARNDGNIALPCGHFEHSMDKTLLDTAIRETQEESGLLVPRQFYTGHHVRKQITGGRTLHSFHVYLPKLKQWFNTGRDSLNECVPFPRFPNYFPIIPATYGHAWVQTNWICRPENKFFTIAWPEIVHLIYLSKSKHSRNLI